MKEEIKDGSLTLPEPSAPRTVLDLFSGIGGFALAFEAAGFQTVAFAEIEPYPCKVLAQHWPEVPNLGDVRGIDGRDFAGVDVVCGGFPCQDISTAGIGKGIEGPRSSLWFEMLRIIEGARPRFCLIENVPALRGRGADAVIATLQGAGYAARPFVVGAWAVGASHKRDRVWVVAYSKGERWDDEPTSGPEQNWKPAEPLRGCGFACGSEDVADADSLGELQPKGRKREQRGWIGDGGWWQSEPAVGRVAYGVPNGAHRIKALGNSIVPAVAYPFALWIGMQLGRAARGEAPEPQHKSPVTTKLPPVQQGGER